MKFSTLRAALIAATALASGSPLAAVPPFTNRLIHSADPYLLLHAHNPVDWYPWGPEAFARAKTEGKPIFLSVGYYTCYWCHVAEKTIYSDPAIAKLMNEWFVNVKVDREEQPDVDRLYMDATMMLDGHGAWPNNLFLTPEGAPFFAGSYFPPQDDGDTPGFPKVLAAIHDLWTNHRAEKVDPAASDMMKALRALSDRQAAAGAPPVVPRAWLAAATRMLLPSIDAEHGGLGSPKAGPKFPQAPALALLSAAARIDGDRAAGAALAETLDGMAFGGIDDHFGGGFFRYATDPAWSVPHFETMLTDNAQLLALYAGRGAGPNGGALDRETARAVAGFLLRDMRVDGGGFATALDAETGGIEGGTYLWTRAQIETVLGDAETERFLAVYELTPLEHQRGADAPSVLGPAPGVLRVRLPIAETLKRAGAADPAALLQGLAPLRAKLQAARATRPQPARDDKIVTGWNGLAIGALARAAVALEAPDLATAAREAADLIWTKAYDPKTGALAHQIFRGVPAVDGTPEDYAALGVGYLDLADATKDPTWRGHAANLADAMLTRFLKPDGRLQAGAGLLPVALGDNEDADLPSGTSSALDLLGRLASGPDGARFATAQAKMALALSGAIGAHPSSWPSAVTALAAHPPSAAALAAAAPPKPERVASNAPAALPHAPATSEHVHARAVAASGAGGRIVTVTLDVDPGWHVNAHVPSLDYLVPTDLAFQGATAGAVTYPAAQTFQPEFSKTPLAVYEGAVTLTATLPEAAAGWRASVTAQACDAHTCLPPSTVPVAIENRPVATKDLPVAAKARPGD